MKNSISKVQGFTIVELLVVIAIIALLTGIIMTSLAPSKSKARDAKRISDIGNIQVALELYFDRCKSYPTTLDVGAATNCVTSTGTVNLGTFISVIPISPSPGSYGYITRNAAPYDDYVLFVTLENNNEILKDDLDGTITIGSSFANCDSNGSNEKIYCVGPK